MATAADPKCKTCTQKRKRDGPGQKERTCSVHVSMIGKRLLESDMTADAAPATAELRKQRFRGVLLGGAVGDALGAAVEFMQRTEILSWFGPHGIRDFVPVDGRL